MAHSNHTKNPNPQAQVFLNIPTRCPFLLSCSLPPPPPLPAFLTAASFLFLSCSSFAALALAYCAAMDLKSPALATGSAVGTILLSAAIGSGMAGGYEEK